MPPPGRMHIIHYLILAPEINSIVWGCVVGRKPETIHSIMRHVIVCHTVAFKLFIDMLIEVNLPCCEQHLLLFLAICGGQYWFKSKL